MLTVIHVLEGLKPTTPKEWSWINMHLSHFEARTHIQKSHFVLVEYMPNTIIFLKIISKFSFRDNIFIVMKN